MCTEELPFSSLNLQKFSMCAEELPFSYLNLQIFYLYGYLMMLNTLSPNTLMQFYLQGGAYIDAYVCN
jgi:hypothetical protein